LRFNSLIESRSGFLLRLDLASGSRLLLTKH
jgi:hypothetical protein